MEKVFITGISGYIGSKLVSRLIQIENMKEIVGIDIVQPNVCHDKVTFYKRDVREPVEHILNHHNIDTIVHPLQYAQSVNRNDAELEIGTAAWRSPPR